MKQPDIVFRFLFPADKNSTKAIKPAMGSLNNPSTGPFSGVYSQLLNLITAGFDVCSIAELFSKLPHLIKIVSLIKTEVLPVVRSWFRPLQDNTVERCLHQFHIVPICPIYRKADRNACPITQYRTLNSCFAPVSRVFACFSPRPAVLWSWLHPWIAISSPDHADRHIPAVRFPKTEETLPLAPIPGIVHALLNLSIYLLHQGLSIGTLFLKQTRCRSLPFDKTPAFCRPRVDGCLPALAAAVRFCSTVHQKFSSGLLLFLLSCFSPTASVP